LSEMTSIFGKSENTRLVSWWIGFSRLEAGKSRIQLPLVANPYVKEVSDVRRECLLERPGKDAGVLRLLNARNGKWQSFPRALLAWEWTSD